MTKTRHEQSQFGLCADCIYHREIVSGKGSRFLYCLRAESDDRYTKYPRLPVVQCEGYEAPLENPGER